MRQLEVDVGVDESRENRDRSQVLAGTRRTGAPDCGDESAFDGDPSVSDWPPGNRDYPGCAITGQLVTTRNCLPARLRGE